MWKAENIWPSYASYFAFHSLGALVSWEIVVFARPKGLKEGRKGRVWTKWGTCSSGVDSQVGRPAPSQTETYSQDARQSQQKGSILLFHSTPLLPACWRQPPKTTRLCCKQHTCWLHSPSGPAPSLARPKAEQAGLFTTWTQSRSCSNCSIYPMLAHDTNDERYKPANDNRSNCQKSY